MQRERDLQWVAKSFYWAPPHQWKRGAAFGPDITALIPDWLKPSIGDLVPRHLRPDVRELVPKDFRPSIGSLIPYKYRPDIGEIFRMKPVRITKMAAEDAAKEVRLTDKSILIIEGSEHLKVYELEKFTALAEKHGAKLVLVGERSSPEGRGTAFGALARDFGAVDVEPPRPRSVEAD